ncbi:MAG TPA: hypothetical protein VK071_05880 [Tissierellales bacterium]|nr:hypothetical protein [Tissierellales bacterium]
MLDEEGYFLIEILIGILLLSLIAMIVLPIIYNSNNNFMKTKIKMDMSFLSETIIENLKGYENIDSLEKYILDIKLEQLIDLLNEDGKVIVKLPLNKKNTTDYPYLVTIIKDDIDIRLWKVSVKVEEHDERKEGVNVSYEAYMRKPRKKL